MEELIGVQIEGQKYVEFLPVREYTRAKMRLTTVKDFQTRAKIKIFLFRDNQKKLLKELELDNIPPEKAGVPDINLFGEFDRRRRLSIRVELNGTHRLQTVLHLASTQELRRTTVLVPVIVVVAGILIFFLWKGGVLGTGEKTPVPETTKPVGHSVTAEKPSASEALASSTLKGDPVQVRNPESKDTEKESKYTTVQFATQVVYFNPNSAMLTDETKKALDGIVSLLGKHGKSKFSISGHCALFGTEWGREKLSKLRAENVYSYLKEIGWEPPVEPEIQGFGGKRSVTEEKTLQHLNRRVEIAVAEK